MTSLKMLGLRLNEAPIQFGRHKVGKERFSLEAFSRLALNGIALNDLLDIFRFGDTQGMENVIQFLATSLGL